MKAQAFLDLVGEMRAAQSKYFKERTQSNLIAAKDLEKRVDVVVKAGKLEPDVPASEVFSEVEYQERLRFFEELKLLAKRQPNDEQIKLHTEDGNEH